MPAFQLTPAAIDDLDQIWSFIAADNIDAANHVELTILKACEALARNPQMGRIRPDLTSRPVRFWTIPQFTNYLVVYRPNTEPVQIVRVLHGKRDVPVVLENER